MQYLIRKMKSFTGKSSKNRLIVTKAFCKLVKKTVFRFVFSILIVLVAEQISFSQCEGNNATFSEGEDLRYMVYYNWGFIWLNAGWVNFQIKPKNYKGEDVLHFDAKGASHKSYDWLYKVRDHYQAYVQKETMLPLWFHRVNYEGGFEVNNKYFFDWESNKVFTFTQNSDKPFAADTVEVPDCTVDVLTLIYYARNLNFEGLKINETVPVISIIDNVVYNLHIRYLGKEKIKDKKGSTFKCIKFSALLVEGTMFKGGEDLIVWVTEDKNKIPILVEAKILVGSVKAYLESYTGLTYPLNAKIN